MGSLRLTDDCIQREMDFIRNNWNSTGVTLHLFKNNHTPTDNDTIGDYTEADFGGYASQSFGDWGAASVAAHVATSVSPTKTFTADGTSSNTIYGYYLTDNSFTRLLWAQRDDAAPVTIGTLPGDQYFVIPVRTHKSEFA